MHTVTSNMLLGHEHCVLQLAVSDYWGKMVLYGAWHVLMGNTLEWWMVIIFSSQRYACLH